MLMNCSYHVISRHESVHKVNNRKIFLFLEKENYIDKHDSFHFIITIVIQLFLEVICT